MVIFCPSCQKALRLPETYEGKSVRCPGCRNVFVAAASGGEIQAEAPPVAPPPAAYEEAPSRPGRRRRDEEDDDEPERIDAGLAEAKHSAWRGAMFLIFAGSVTLVARLVGLLVTLMVDTPVPPEGVNNLAAYQVGRGLGMICCAGTTIVLTVFMFLGASNLIGLRSRGMALTGSIMCFVAAGLDLTFWVGCNTLGLAFTPRGQMPTSLGGVIYTQLTAGMVIVIVNLASAVVSLIVVNNADVRDAMHSHRRRRRRSRD